MDQHASSLRYRTFLRSHHDPGHQSILRAAKVTALAALAIQRCYPLMIAERSAPGGKMVELPSVTPAKQRRSRETHNRILSAASSLVASKTFDEVTMNELCLTASVSSSSFYARFHSKEEVILALFELHSQQARANATVALREIDARQGSGEEKVRALLRSYMRFVRRNRPVMVSIFAEPSLIDRYFRLSSCCERGLLPEWPRPQSSGQSGPLHTLASGWA